MRCRIRVRRVSVLSFRWGGLIHPMRTTQGTKAWRAGDTALGVADLCL